MLTRRTGLTALTAVVIAGAATAALQGSATAAPTAPPAVHGIAHLNTQVNLPAGVWTNVPVQVVLPRAGTYDLDADVRGRLAGFPAVNAFITARLWNATTGAAVPQSERIVYQMIDQNAGDAQAGGNATAPISEEIKVSKPTTITLQAIRTDAAGAANIAQIYSDGNGYTSLRFDRVGP
jgi:hypothetical protein